MDFTGCADHHLQGPGAGAIRVQGYLSPMVGGLEASPAGSDQHALPYRRAATLRTIAYFIACLQWAQQAGATQSRMGAL
jgi:hypothetical protein